MSSISPAEMKSLQIAKHYSDQKGYNSLLHSIFNTPELYERFWAALNHDIHLISQRSQQLEDHEINLTQKAFKLLHSQGKLLPAANVYVEMILGIAPTTTSAVLDRALVVRRPETPHEKACQREETPQAPGHSNKVADLFKSQIGVYQKAKEAFQDLPPKSVDATRAARFLRDTTENLISYIESLESENRSGRKPSPESLRKLLLELHETLRWTNELVESRFGGKKRVWEQSMTQQDQVERALQGLDTHKRIKGGKEDDAREVSREKPGLPQSPGRKEGRIQHNDGAAAFRPVQHDIGRHQSPSTRSRNRKGRRRVLHDVYRPKKP